VTPFVFAVEVIATEDTDGSGGEIVIFHFGLTTNSAAERKDDCLGP
jgi:hypothetical protein